MIETAEVVADRHQARGALAVMDMPDTVLGKPARSRA